MAKHDDFFSGDLSAQNVNLTETGWYSSFGKDFVILHNPVYRYQNHQPYKLDQVAMIYCEKGMAKGSVNLTPYRLEPEFSVTELFRPILQADYRDVSLCLPR